MCEPLEIQQTKKEEWCLELHVTHDDPLTLGNVECERMKKYKEYLFMAYIAKVGMDKHTRKRYEEAWDKHLIIISRYDEYMKDYKEAIVLHIKTSDEQNRFVI